MKSIYIFRITVLENSLLLIIFIQTMKNFIEKTVSVHVGMLTLFLLLPFMAGATRVSQVKVIDKNYIAIHFEDGKVEFRDDGKGSGAYGGHHNDASNNWVVRFGKPLNTQMAESIECWSITSADDDNYEGTSFNPLSVYRKTKMNGHSQKEWSGNDFKYYYTHEHFIYLEMPYEMQNGNTYTINLCSDLYAADTTISFTYDIFTSKSAAVHVNVVGYLSSNDIKAADLYYWMGDAGARDYASFEGNKVYLYDVRKGTTHEVGEVTFWKAENSNDVGYYNMMQSDVWNADFTGFTTPGLYRLAIEGVGCSDEFEIRDNIYSEPFKVSLQGFFYMRIGQDSVGVRPVPRRPLYIPGQDPENMKIVVTNMDPYHPDWSGGGDRWDQPGFFDNYIKDGAPENPNAVGGHSDALDWDRHLGHVSIIYDMLLPYFITNGALSEDNTGIAESGNGIPDILDEARYEVDFWLRLRYGKGYGHGLTNPDNQNIMYQANNTAIAAWANAANAAMLANCFMISGHTDLMNEYKDSAEIAYNYAASLADPMLDYTQSLGEALLKGRDFKMMAAAFLYNVTGNTAYEDVVKEESLATTTSSTIKDKDAFSQLWATAAYLHTPQSVNYPALYENMKQSIINEAKLSEANHTMQRQSRRATDDKSGYFHTIQNVQRTIIAHSITDDPDDKAFFKNALILEADWSLGRNPLNMIQMTTYGTSLRSENSVLNIYSSGRNDGSYGLHPGHTPYMNTDDWACGMTMGCPSKLYEQGYPAYSQWPRGEAYYNTRYVWAHNEFTPQQTMRGKMALYGYLHTLGSSLVNARNADDPYDYHFLYQGRTDMSKDAGPVFYYAGSSVETYFEGTAASVILTDINSKDAQRVFFMVNEDTMSYSIEPNTTDTFNIASGLTDSIHLLKIYKMEGPGAGALGLQFNELLLDNDKGILPVPGDFKLKLSFYGDSFTEGVGGNCLGDDGDCGQNNGYFSYANVAARILNADIHNNGIGGLAVKDNTGWYQSQTTGLQTTYNKLNPSNENGNEYTMWDFDRFTPDVVVFAMGINDAFGAGDPLNEPENWKTAYKEIIREIVDEHGKHSTQIVIAPGNIKNDAYELSQQVALELREEQYMAAYFQYSFDLDAHPTRAEHAIMGKELAVFIDSLEFKGQQRITYTLEATATDGSIIKSPEAASYVEGTMVTLEAVPQPSGSFLEWTGDVNAKDSVIHIIMNKDIQVEALFVKGTGTRSAQKDISVKIFPNPASETLNINLYSPKEVNYSIIDGTSRLVKTGLLKNTENIVSLKGIHPGVYFISINQNTDIIYRTTILVERN